MRGRYGPPLVAKCPACAKRVKVVQGGKLRPHGNGCPGGGQPASPARREQPARDGYGPRNVIDFIITPDLPDYPKPSANTAVALKRTAAEDLNDEINI